jgi:biotin/methionine sulfoxide reductase
MPTGRNPTGCFIPVARIADLLLEPGRPIPYDGKEITLPQQRIVYWAGGNPFHHHQDLNRLVKAWRQPETVIVHEISWTPTARFADIVLPVTTTLERNDVGASSGARHILAMRSIAPKYQAARNDHDIFADLADRLGFKAEFTEGRSEMEWIGHLYETARLSNAQSGVELPPFDRFWQEGVHELPELDPPYVAYADFRRDPQAHPLKTPSGKIEIFSETIASFALPDCPGHPVWIEPREWLGSELARKYPLHLISNQPKTRLHSQLDAVGESRRSKVAGRETITLNAEDAAARGLAEGDLVRVFNDRGACLAAVAVSDAILRGVAQLPTGAWFDPLDPAEPGSLEVHGNPNVLTHDLGTSSLTGGASAQTVLVEVERFAGPAPEVKARKAPAIA